MLSRLEPLDLRFPGRDLDRDVNILSGGLLLGSDAFVEAVQDFLVRHLLDLRAYRKMRRRNSRVSERDDGIVTVARDTHLVARGNMWTLHTHRVSLFHPMVL
jgi:hypothetical protein